MIGTEFLMDTVLIDMNTGKTISGISLDGTATKPCDLYTYMTNRMTEYDPGDYYATPLSDTTITGSAISSDQNLVLPYTKPFLDGINSGKISPYSPDSIDVGVFNPTLLSDDHGGKYGIYNYYDHGDYELTEHGQNTTLHKFMDDAVISYTENLLYLTLKTR